MGWVMVVGQLHKPTRHLMYSEWQKQGLPALSWRHPLSASGDGSEEATDSAHDQTEPHTVTTIHPRMPEPREGGREWTQDVLVSSNMKGGGMVGFNPHDVLQVLRQRFPHDCACNRAHRQHARCY